MEKKTETCFKTACYAQQGIGHAQHGRPCEDVCATYTQAQSGVTAIALSDGAGSYAHAGEGARITSDAAAKCLACNFDRIYDYEDPETASDYILNRAVRKALSECAVANNYTMESLSATLLVAAMHPDGRYMTYHVGDGVILAYERDGQMSVVSQYEHEQALNLTTFVTIAGTEFIFSKGQGECFGFLLTSDGAEKWLVSARQPDGKTRSVTQMAFFLPEARVSDEMAGIVELLRDKHEPDDMSFAVIADKRRASTVMSQMDKRFREALFGVPTDASKRVEQKTAMILDVLADHPNGLDAEALCKKLHVRNRTALERKLDVLIYVGVVTKNNGKYYF